MGQTTLERVWGTFCGSKRQTTWKECRVLFAAVRQSTWKECGVLFAVVFFCSINSERFCTVGTIWDKPRGKSVGCFLQ